MTAEELIAEIDRLLLRLYLNMKPKPPVFGGNGDDYTAAMFAEDVRRLVDGFNIGLK